MSKPLKVMHLTYDMRIGGTEQVILNLVRGMRDEFELSVFCIEQPLGPFGEMLQQQGTAIHSVNRQPGFDTSLLAAIRKVVKEQQIDILHCHQYTPYSYGLLATLGCKTKVVFTEHGRFYPDRSSWKRKLLNPVLALFTSEITAISQATKQALVDFEALPERRIKVIYNAIEDPQPKLTGEVPALLQGCQGPILGTIARLDPIKNQRMMLRAFAEVFKQHPSASLLIVGDGPERQALESLAEQLGIQNAVIFAGYQAVPFDWLARMDLFLLPSLSEGTSMTLLEAMALGKVCAVTDAGGNPEIVADQQTGSVTANDDQQAYQAALLELLASPDKREQMAQAARQRYQEHFSLQTMCQQFRQLYLSLA